MFPVSMQANKNKLAIGTVQFGADYGIANKTGKVCMEEASSILNFAWESGVDTLDTAIVYGESETLLGNIGIAKWKVISKIPSVPPDCTNIDAWVKESVNGSLDRLKIKTLHAILLHNAAELFTDHGKELYQSLLTLKAEGKIGKTGVSIYDPSELDCICPDFAIDMVQAPLNIFDRRLINSGWLHKLQHMNVEVHIRSVFLQGLLLMEPQERPPYFDKWQHTFDNLDKWIAEENISRLHACIGFALHAPGISRIVVGVDNRSHLEQIAAMFALPTVDVPGGLASADIDLITPSRWKKNE